MRWSKADICHSADFSIIEHINRYVLLAGIVHSVKSVGPETYQPFELNFPEVLASPTSSTNSSSGPSGVEKRLPCEFCGRCFTNSLEWERHVLRHGMLVIFPHFFHFSFAPLPFAWGCLLSAHSQPPWCTLPVFLVFVQTKKPFRCVGV